MIKSGAFVIAGRLGCGHVPVRIIYGTKDGRLHLFCKVRIVFGEPIPAADLQIRDQSHKMAELRRMKNRLRDELEQLLADNAFAMPVVEAAPEPEQLPEKRRVSCRGDARIAPQTERQPQRSRVGDRHRPQQPVKRSLSMEIIRAKTAGFCFGVDRAVKLTYDLLAQGRKVATLGPLIHNAQVVADLEAKGAVTCPDIDAVPDGYEVIIRSHGVPRSVYDKISTRSLAYHDATCPFVAKIHKIAMEADKNGALLLVAGDATTPKYREVVGHTSGPVQVLPIWRSCKIAPHAFATRIHLRRRANDISRGKLGKLQSFFKKKSVQKARIF